MILAGDVGGTKTLLGLFARSPNGLRCVREERFESAAHASLEALVRPFVHDLEALDAACFGVPGAVVDGQARTTNLPWTLTEDALRAACGVPRLALMNDLEASALGVLRVAPEDLVDLNAGDGTAPRGHVAVLAPGTGLGEGLLYWDGERHHPIASEGGHGDFAARNDDEIALLRFLMARHRGRVSWERVLSGPGLLDVYHFTRERSGQKEPSWLSERMAAGDPSRAVSEAGIAGDDPACAAAISMFVSMLGAEAGNMALRTLARGGVYLAGGIPPQILPALEQGAFLEAFLDKGRFRSLLEGIRVAVCKEPRAALLGCAHRAAELARDAD